MSTKTIHHYEIRNLENVRSNSLLTFKKGLEGFIAIAGADHCKLVFLSQAYVFKRFQTYFDLKSESKTESSERLELLTVQAQRVSELMKKTADEYKIPILDMNLVMNQQDSLFAGELDAVHFSKNGSDFFGQNVYNFLKNQLLIDQN